MVCNPADVAFAKGRSLVLAGLASSSLEAEVVDRWYEGLHHSLIILHSCLGKEEAPLIPFLDFRSSSWCERLVLATFVTAAGPS